MNAAHRDRLLSGFSSWKGAVQTKKDGTKLKQSAHGMLWVDHSGQSGRYTGDLNDDGTSPHGRGIMKYDFGLIAEGDWVNGTLLSGGQTPSPLAGGMMGGTVAPSIMGGTLAPGHPGMIGGASVFHGGAQCG